MFQKEKKHRICFTCNNCIAIASNSYIFRELESLWITKHLKHNTSIITDKELDTFLFNCPIKSKITKNKNMIRHITKFANNNLSNNECRFLKIIKQENEVLKSKLI